MIFTYQITRPELLKDWLKRHQFSKKTVSAIKQNGALIINGQPVTVRKMLLPHDILQVQLPQEYPSVNLQPYDKQLDICYEDKYILVVRKYQQQNCTPSREHPHYSLIEQVLYYCQHNGEDINPHIVTRLDRDTEGLVVFAKYGHIHHLFSTVTLQKTYIALVNGQTDSSGVIEANIKRSPNSIITREIAQEGKYAKTSYRTLAQNHHYSICQIQLHTGRTHQIRVHFKHIGHSIVGDDLYGGTHPTIQGQALQCSEILFEHPIEKKLFSISIDYKRIIKLFKTI